MGEEQARVDYYSELRLCVHAAIFSMPTPAVALIIHYSQWGLAMILWVAATIGAIGYGYWVREDDGGDKG